MLTPTRKTLSLAIGVAALVTVVAATSAGAAALITGAQIKNGTVESIDIKNGSIKALDIATGAKASLRGEPGAPGAPGTPGTPGNPGAPGAPGVSDYTLVTSGVTSVPASGGTGVARAICPPGLRVISGGGYLAIGSLADTALTSSAPDAVDGNGSPIWVSSATANAWTVSASNDSAIAHDLQAYAICGSVN